MERLPLDRTKLSPSSSRFAARLFAAIPDLAEHAQMERAAESFELIVEVSSPTGDSERTLVLWMEAGEPSLGFGAWHTHAGLFGDIEGTGCDGLIDYAVAILADKLVLCCDSVIDLRDEDAVADALTDEDAPATLNLRSWGGSSDRRVGLADLA